jgi:hypothetical protein
MSSFKPFTISRATCEKRIADAKFIGWVALAESWQRDLDRLSAPKQAAPDNQQRKN